MSRVRQNGCYRGTKLKTVATGNFYYDLSPVNTGIFDTQTIYDSFSGTPSNREGFNEGYGTLQNISAGTYDFFSTTSINSTFQPNMNNIWYRRRCIAFTYTASELQSASGWNPASPGTVVGLEYFASSTSLPSSSYSPLPNYSIAMCHMPAATTNNASNPSDTSVGRTNLTRVKNAHNHTISLSGWRTFNFETSFAYNGIDNLGFIVGWGQCPTGYTQAGCAYIATGGTLYYTQSDAAGYYDPMTQLANSSLSNIRPRIRLIMG